MLDEPSDRAKYYTNAELLQWWNVGYVAYVKKTNCLYDMTNIVITGGFDNDVDSTANSPAHIMPVNFAHVNPFHGVWWNTSDSKPFELDPTDRLQLSHEGKFSSYNIAGTPSLYTVEGRRMSSDDITLNVFPYPDANNNYLQCYYTPIVSDITSLDAPLVDDDDAMVITNYAVSLGKKKRQLSDEATSWMNAFSAGVDERIADMARQLNKPGVHVTRPNLKYKY